MAPEPGTLYLVATPIGNLEDITLRALRILREVDLVACEDTRHTRGLLAHHGIRTPTISLHEHNERARIPDLLDRLRQGTHVALVSDAGTPAVSDPGAVLVAEAARQGVPIVPIPGASAVTAAVPLADFPAGRFVFAGFLPRQRGERRRLLEGLRDLPMALVFFEAPHRVRDALADLGEVLGTRRLVLVRELTKVHEQVLRGPASEILEILDRTPRGEVTLVVEGAPGQPGGDQAGLGAGAQDAAGQGAGRQPPEVLLRQLVAKGLTRRDAARVLEVVYGMPARDAYRMTTVGDDNG